MAQDGLINVGEKLHSDGSGRENQAAWQLGMHVCQVQVGISESLHGMKEAVTGP